MPIHLPCLRRGLVGLGPQQNCAHIATSSLSLCECYVEGGGPHDHGCYHQRWYSSGGTFGRRMHGNRWALLSHIVTVSRGCRTSGGGENVSSGCNELFGRGPLRQPSPPAAALLEDRAGICPHLAERQSYLPPLSSSPLKAGD